MRITIVLVLDGLITILACNILGPAALKLGGIGLVGWAARAPFYLLRFYIGPAVLFAGEFHNWYVTGALLGAALTLPLALWSTVPGCPAAEKWLNLTSGVLQGLLLAYAAHRLKQTAAETVRSN